MALGQKSTSKAQDENGEVCCEANELTRRHCFGIDEIRNLLKVKLSESLKDFVLKTLLVQVH